MNLERKYDNYGKKRYILKFRKPTIKIKYKTFMRLHNFYHSFKNFNKKYLFLILTIIWMGIIFLFSHQPAYISSNTSSNVKVLFSNIEFFKILFNIVPIRKMAHFFLYFCLSFLIYKTIINLKCFVNLNSIYISSIFISFIYACTDEFHQYFIPGRGAHFRDVLIDTSGAIICILLIIIFNLLKNSYLKKRLN